MFHPFEINERMLVREGEFEDLIEEGAAGAEDHPVALDLFLVLTGQRHVTELMVVVMTFEGLASTLVKLFPDQLVALRSHAGLE